MQLNDLQLVHVSWGEDEGLVSLTLGKVLCYCYGHEDFTVCVECPYASIDDRWLERNGYDNEVSWDEVPGIIRKHPELVV